jgi:hypothetical protein
MRHQTSSSIPESVILTDWAADGENLGKNPEAVLYEILLLSLLYDKILIQDEVFALSNKMARWFSDEMYSDLLRKCFDLGTLVILKHPIHAYPTDDLKELSLDAPILARAKYIQRFGTRGEHRFHPRPHQRALYDVIDQCLQTRPGAQRPVGSLMQLDIMSTFGNILHDVLSSGHYARWRDSAFRGVTDDMAEDFVHFVEEPERLAAKLKDYRQSYVILPDPQGKPIFNRSLAYQAASLYPPRQSRAMQRLIQTVFAAPFSWRENAAGRYSRSLRELLWLPSGAFSEAGDYQEEGEIVSVEAHVDVPIVLPKLSSDFVDAIVRVRKSEPGRKLRESVRQMGEEVDFKSQENAWREVADELASTVVYPKSINIRTAIIRIGKDMALGSVAGGLFEFVREGRILVPEVLAGAFLEGALGLVFNHGLEVLRNDLQRQRVRQQLEHAVEFRCSSPAMPPFVSDQSLKSTLHNRLMSGSRFASNEDVSTHRGP